MIGRRAVTAVCICWSVGAAVHADITVSASVDKTTVAMGDSLVLEVRVSGDRLSMPSPELPPLSDFRVANAGTSSSISFGGSGVSATVTHRYMLSPIREGTFRIGPVSVRSGSQVVQAEPIDITVVAATQRTVPMQPNTYRGSGRGLFVEAFVDRTTVYVAQQITWTFRFYTRVPLLQQPRYSPPEVQGFHAEDLPPQRTYETIIDGQRYSVVEIKRALFPVTAGKAVIGSATLICTVQDFNRRDPFADDFFGSFFGPLGREIELRSDPMELRVLPLPEPHPPAFRGAVGTYRFDVTVEGAHNAEVNRTQMMTITIRGTGNVGSVTYPKSLITEALGDAFAVFEPATSFEMTKENYRVAGTKVFSVPIAPRRAGELTVPPIRFSYFDPTGGRYVTLTSHPIRLSVKTSPETPAETRDIQGTSPSRGGRTGPAVLEDIRHIKREPLLGRDSTAPPAALMLANAIPPMVWAVCALVMAVRRESRRDLRRYRATSAARRARRALADVRRTAGGEDICRTAERLQEVLSGFLADRMGVSPEGLTRDQVTAAYRGRLSGDLLQRLEKLWEDLHYCRFAPGGGDPGSVARLLDRTSGVIGELDNETQKK